MNPSPQRVKDFDRTFSSGSWLGPPLRTLRQPVFDAACAELMCRAEAHFDPTLIVGIRTGGLIVAQSMARVARTSLTVLPVTSRRATTAVKARIPLFRRMLTTLPGPAIDALRRAEHQWITTRRAGQPPRQWVDPSETEAVADALRAAPAPRRLLLVDDAVDSGATLAAVLRALQETCPPDTRFCTAAITQTLPDPMLMPDLVLYHGILCRFPWSFDAVA